MRNRSRSILCAALLVSAGCSAEPATPPEAIAPAVTTAAKPATSEPPGQRQPPPSDAANTAARAGEETALEPGASEAAETSLAPFMPPFPNRVELFVPPRRSQPDAMAQNGQTEMVKLYGFVKVDDMRAVLTINGVSAPLAKGESRHGIEVIEIEPPKVVLQRGRERWVATLGL